MVKLPLTALMAKLQEALACPIATLTKLGDSADWMDILLTKMSVRMPFLEEAINGAYIKRESLLLLQWLFTSLILA